MRKKYVFQDEEKDCGVICLYNIIKYYKGNVDIDRLKDKLKTDKNGTSVYNIVKISDELGLKSIAYECELNDLCSLNFPIIAYLKIHDKYDHFIIIDKIIDDELIIFDPIRGYLKYDFDEFSKEFKNIIITFEKTEKLVKEKNNDFIKKTYDYMSKNSILILIILLLSFSASFLSIIISLYFSYLYDNINISIKILLCFLLISIIKLLIDYIRNNILLKYSKTLDSKITINTYNKIISLPIKFHHDRPVGDIVARINDLSVLKEFINTISFTFIIDLIYILLILGILFLINKIIFIVFVIFVVLYILIYLCSRNKINKQSLILKEDISNVNSNLVESLFGIDTIKNLNLESIIKSKFKDTYNHFLNNNYSFNKTIINLEQVQDFISTITSIVITYLGIYFYKKNILSLSNVIIYNSLIISFFISLKNIISLDELFVQSKNSYKRINSLFKEKMYTSQSKKINYISKILISNLYYSYNTSKTLNNINFSIDKGDYIFIKGKSGSGKSTICKLITKQLKCDKDMIKINNIDINELSKDDILNNICYVSQNEYIFTDTILNNIKVYKEASKKQIDKVIKVTGINKLLKDRNITLDFLLEENGHNISGGERQRIILARSLLQNKKVLILDETMNELDIDTEKDIIKKLKKEFNITLILISHRDNNSDLFDKIIEI